MTPSAFLGLRTAIYAAPDLGRAKAWYGELAHGAQVVSAPADVGGGLQVAVARDPFGNLLAVIENPHFPNTA
jgi:predicted enzyme related to lactoylglutathione lyase